MDDARIREIISELDAFTSSAEAEVELSEDESGFHLIATRLGFIRLSRECLQAAIEPLKAGREVLKEDWKYLFVGWGAKITKISRAITLQNPPPLPETAWERIGRWYGTIFGLVLVVFLIASLLVGMYTIAKYIFF
jgi:hypothetical protein